MEHAQGCFPLALQSHATLESLWCTQVPHSTSQLRNEQLTVANIKSQIKRIGQNNAARDRNKGVRSSIKTAIKHFNEALEKGDENAAKLARAVGKKLDKAAAKGVLHKNQAANRKSAIDKKLTQKKK